MIRMVLALICAAALQAEAPPLNYRPGTVWTISHEAGTRRYEYDIIDEKIHFAYITTSSKEIRVTARAKIMFAIEGHSLYIIDESGKSQRTKYLRQEKLRPPPPPVP